MENEKRTSYQEQLVIDNTLKLRELLQKLPPFVKDYFRAIEPTTSAKTRISYAYDLRVFFNYLIDNNPLYKNHSTDQFTFQDLENLEAIDIEEYLDYLKVYNSPDDKQITNTERGLARKFSALCSLYRYLYKHKYISQNPTVFVDKPKIHDKAIIRLDVDEVAMLLDYVEECGHQLTGQKISEHNEDQRANISPYDFSYFVLNDHRDLLYKRIDQRVDEMVVNGLIEEVQALKDMGYDRSYVSMQALGYKEIFSYLEGEITLEEAVYRIKRDTRHFAKRQLTWFGKNKDINLIK